MERPEDDLVTNNSAEIFNSLPECELIINKELRISLAESRPNWWWRLWQYLLLGFVWKDLTKK